MDNITQASEEISLPLGGCFPKPHNVRIVNLIHLSFLQMSFLNLGISGSFRVHYQPITKELDVILLRLGASVKQIYRLLLDWIPAQSNALPGERAS